MTALIRQRVVAIAVLLLSWLIWQTTFGQDTPPNLARTAQVRTTSEYSNRYAAEYATDGKIPTAGSQSADLDAAWCVRKERTGDTADFGFQWDRPVPVSQLIYFGRTSWYMSECFRDYEVLVGDSSEPVVRGRLQMVHGPQRIDIPPTETDRVTLRFLNSYGGPNPGAAEIMVFSEPLSQSQLGQLHRQSGSFSAERFGSVQPEVLRELILSLWATHGADYRTASHHLTRLSDLAERMETDPSAEEQLAQLQREVLLFDVQQLIVIKRQEITASHVYTYHYEGQRDGGGLYLVAPQQPDSEPLQLVDSEQGQILDCDLSYDGRRVLFSWRQRADEGYHLWQVDADGTDLTQLTDGPWHDYNACWLPDGGIGFLSTRSPQFAYCWHAPVGVLHRMNADGTGIKRLSANYLNDFTPSVLEDGRIIYSRWEYVDRPAIPIQSLWTIAPDGTGLDGYFGNRVLSPGTFMEARQIPGTEKIVCTMTGHNGPTRGAIGIIDRSRGVNAQAAIENITPDVPVPGVAEGNGNTSGSKQYSSPVPLDDQRLLLSARGPVLVRDLAGTCQAVVLPAPTDGMQYFCATPVRSRTRPPAIPPAPVLDPTSQMATVYLQDVYQGLEPHVKRGEVTTIRIVRELQKTVRIDPSLRAFGFQFPVISCGATYAGKDVIGEIDVNPDGSAYFQVPASVPLYFMALDAQGRAVQRMRSFTHFMPGEVQGCIGCHEHRLRSPHAQLADVAAPPQQPRPPEWESGGFDYARVVQPVLDRHCIKCHDSMTPPKGIDLTGDVTDYFNVSYDVLAREHQGGRGSPWVNWIPTYNGQEWNILEVDPKQWGSPQSRLAEVILSNHPDEDGVPRVALAEFEQRRILAWIDLNVPYYGSSETAHPTAPGCRRMYPPDLDAVLSEVAARRCVSCHQDSKIPRREWTRITNPDRNGFLLAPLAESAGGTGRCGQAVFADTQDPDYQAILATFQPVLEQLTAIPRIDMPGGKPSSNVNRCCQ